MSDLPRWKNKDVLIIMAAYIGEKHKDGLIIISAYQSGKKTQIFFSKWSHCNEWHTNVRKSKIFQNVLIIMDHLPR